MIHWKNYILDIYRHDNEKFMRDLGFMLKSESIVECARILKYYEGYYESLLLTAYHRKIILANNDNLEEISELRQEEIGSNLYVEGLGIFQLTFLEKLDAQNWLKKYNVLSHSYGFCGYG